MYPKGDFLCQRTYSMSMDGWNLGRTSTLFTVLSSEGGYLLLGSDFGYGVHGECKLYPCEL